MSKSFNLKVILFDEFERFMIFKQPINAPSNNGNTGIRGQAKDPENSIKQAMRRARQKIIGYILANEWQYWATQTFSDEKIDRFNIDEIVRKYNKKLKNLKQNKYYKLSWLIVPEQHKNGAWHLHMLMNGIPSEKVVYSGYDYINKKNGYIRPVYNWLDTIEFGFNDYVYIGNVEPLERIKIANYISKYITKELVTGRFNKKLYWTTKGLKLPKVKRFLTNNINIEEYVKHGIVINKSNYNIIDDETGYIFNNVEDILIYNPLQF